MTWNPEPLIAADPDPRATPHLVPMRDGVRLATDVYLPEDVPAPVILIRTCYDKSSWVTFLPLVAEYFNAQGYAVVTQDVRGKFGSEGDSYPFIPEIPDGYDSLDWVVNQDWCDGGIAMFGDSYFAFTAWAAVASEHPALRAIVSRGIATDVAHEVAYRDGVYCLATGAFWAPFTMDRWQYAYEFPLDWDVRPLGDIISSWLPGRRATFFDEARNATPDSSFWKSPSFADVRADRIRIPALHVGGWWEDFRRGQLADWRVARESTKAPQYLLMDASDHFDARLQDDDAPEPDWRETEEGIRAYLPRYLDPAIEFLDREFRGHDIPAPALVRTEIVGGGWWHGDQWPPPASHSRRLHLGAADQAMSSEVGGTLGLEPDSENSVATWIHDPQSLVPSLDEYPFRDLVGLLPDEREVERRPDVLTFTSEASEEPLDLTGPVLVTLDVDAEAARMQVIVKLVDVFPDGRARRITEAAYEDGRKHTPVTLELPDIGYRVLPGHQLRIEVAASCFPRFMPLIDPDGDSWSATEGPRVEYRLSTGNVSTSYVDLTVCSNLTLISPAPWEA